MGYNDEWRRDAACRGMALEVFSVGSRPDQERVIPLAKETCDACPVSSQCLEDAIQMNDTNGVRAGLTGRERRILIQHRRSMIPKKERPDHGTRSGYVWEIKHLGYACAECRTAANRYSAKSRGGYVYGPIANHF